MNEDFEDVPLDSTFGEGPQIDLGDITDLIKDASIVDLSWLQEPITFQHSNSIVPAHKDLEHNWGDTTDSLYGAFKLVKGNPSAREQIKKKNLWNHSEETKDNLYHWTSPSLSKASSAPKRSIVSSLQFLRRLMHRGYTGENLNLEARKYMPQDEWVKAASNRTAVRAEEGILGNVYVDVTAFDSCYKAREVTDKYNKLAKFVQKTASCGDCSFNSQGKCSLLSKKIASKEEIFSDTNTKQYLDYLTSVRRINSDFTERTASLSNAQKLQQAFLTRSTAKKKSGGVKAKLPQPVVKKDFNSAPFIRVASKYLGKGYSADFLKSKLSEKVPHINLDGILKEAARALPEVPADVAPCNSEILKQAKLLSRGSKCNGCAYDMSSHCGINKTAFSSSREKTERKISATFASLPTAAQPANFSGVVKSASRALEQGHSFERVLKAASKIAGTKEASRLLKEAMVQSKGISADQFEDCNSPLFRLASSLKKSSKCQECSFNRGLSCGLTKKAFVVSDTFDPDTVKDHNLYGSFYKDLSLDRMVSVDPASISAPLEVEELNQFNL